MYVLCIETATSVCSVALSKGSELIAVQEIQEANQHASKLHSLVQSCLTQAGIHFSDLSGICVSKGPGSYTGLRVGVSSAKGYAYALGIPMYSVNTLQSLAAVFMEKFGHKVQNQDILIPMIDARRMEVYEARFSSKFQELQATQAHILTSDSFSEISSEKTIHLFGNGSTKCTELLTHPGIRIYDGIEANASGMIPFLPSIIAENKQEDIAYFEPFYLKDFIGKPAKNS